MWERGCVRAVQGPDPAAGAEVSIRVPAGVKWKVLALRLRLVTSATVADRRVDLIIDDGSNTLLVVEPAAVQAASLTRAYNYAPGMPARTVLNAEFVAPLPAPCVLGPEWRLRTSTGNIQTGDNFSSVMLWVEEWLDEYSGRAAA